MRRNNTAVKIPILRDDKMTYLLLRQLDPDITLSDIIDSFRRRSQYIGMFTFKDELYYVVDNYLLKGDKIILYKGKDNVNIVINDTSALFLRQNISDYATVVINYGYTLKNDSNSCERKIFLNTSEIDLKDSEMDKYLKASIALL